MIIRVNNDRHFIEDARAIFDEYYEELLHIDTAREDFEVELTNLSSTYSVLLLAVDESINIGCVALKIIDEQICEMKRLYVRQEHRGQGFGQKLAEEIIKEARNSGCSLMRLDTLSTLDAANSLYHSLGFRQTSAYLEETPVELLYWSLDLK